ncbi:MAG: methenyltetrahydrofolate cyclohydrolase, partial [Spirochaetae bacterium HGW-Spirochaetae-9]
VDEVSADSPAPGGGSVAALAGSLGAALAAMVGNLTVGKKGYEKDAAELASMAVRAQATKAGLLSIVDRDTEAFSAVLEAARLPKANEEQKALRAKRMDEASKQAALVPMATAQSCLKVMEHCLIAVEKGNKNSVTDGAVGALMAMAGMEGALLNVKINLNSIADKAFSTRLQEEVAALRKASENLLSQTFILLEKSLGSA